MLIMRRSKLYYTASGIVTLCRWLSYEIAGFVLGDRLFSVRLYGSSSFAGSI